MYKKILVVTFETADGWKQDHITVYSEEELQRRMEDANSTYGLFSAPKLEVLDVSDNSN